MKALEVNNLKNINDQSIRLKEYLNDEDYKEINKLQKLCTSNDKTALKLELDYKLESTIESNESIKKVNEFLYYTGPDLIGYIGIGCFGGSTLEINGMVHPDCRRQGIFSMLFQLVKDEWVRRDSYEILLLSDQKSHSGQEFIKTTGATYKNSEYEMYLNMNFKSEANDALTKELVFRKASNKDAKEITHQNAIYFNSDDEMILIMPEEEEKRGMTIYLVEVDGEIVGKAHLQIENDQGSIYGFGVLPEH